MQGAAINSSEGGVKRAETRQGRSSQPSSVVTSTCKAKPAAQKS